jgi:hypothetical protein
LAKRLSDFEQALRGLHGDDVDIIDVVPVLVGEPSAPRPWLRRGFITMPPPRRIQRWWRRTAPWERIFSVWLWAVMLIVGTIIGYVAVMACFR